MPDRAESGLNRVAGADTLPMLRREIPFQYNHGSAAASDCISRIQGGTQTTWNVTDEQPLTYAGHTPLSGSSFGTNIFYHFASRLHGVPAGVL